MEDATENMNTCGMCLEQCSHDMVSFGCENFHTFCISCCLQWANEKAEEVTCPNCRDPRVSLVFCPLLSKLVQNRKASPQSAIPKNCKIKDLYAWKQLQLLAELAHDIFPAQFPEERVGNVLTKQQLLLIVRNLEGLAIYNTLDRSNLISRISVTWYNDDGQRHYPDVINIAEDDNVNMYAAAAREIFSGHARPVDVVSGAIMGVFSAYLDGAMRD